MAGITVNCTTGRLEENNDAPTHPVPVLVTMRQARLALLQAGMLDKVEMAIEALESPMKEQARIYWEYSTEVRRDSWLVAALAPALELSAERIDELFIAATAL